MTHQPTHGPAPAMTPMTCWICGRRAGAAGIGNIRKDGDMRLLCDNCQPLAAQIRSSTRLDMYEQNAVTEVIEKSGDTVAANGFDMSQWSHEQVEEFVVGIILGFGTSIRDQIRRQEVPF